ncbi:hypothetical protein LIER_24898 [Lithospermum erythrorhizon]|uniref:Uncharacterized protein n=1 Tax=Lithospermum erythrorhizon TaxID=34254 RepID=A0AAV3R404_LITER
MDMFLKQLQDDPVYKYIHEQKLFNDCPPRRMMLGYESQQHRAITGVIDRCRSAEKYPLSQDQAGRRQTSALELGGAVCSSKVTLMRKSLRKPSEVLSGKVIADAASISLTFLKKPYNLSCRSGKLPNPI